MMDEREKRLSRARIFYRSRAIGACLIIMTFVIADDAEPDGLLLGFAAVMLIIGIITWIVAVIEISEIYGIHASLMPPPWEVMRYQPSARRGTNLAHAKASEPSPLALASKPRTIPCTGDVVVTLLGLSETPAGASLIHGPSSEHAALLQVRSSSIYCVDVEVWIDDTCVTTAKGPELRKYAEIMHRHNVRLSTMVYAGEGWAIAALAEIDTTEAAANLARP